MKFPVQIRCYCPYCKSHQIHKVKLQERKPKSSLKKSERRKRKYTKGHGGHGKYSRPPVSKYKVKVSARPTLVLTCTECGKAHQRGGFGRARKVKVE